MDCYQHIYAYICEKYINIYIYIPYIYIPYIFIYMYVCVCVCGGHEGGENKTYSKDLRENLTEKGGKREISVFLQNHS